MGCGKQRRSVFKDKADDRLCRDCRKDKINENQSTLFEPPTTEEAAKNIGQLANAALDSQKHDAKPLGVTETKEV
jgi:hypothetical protein